MRRSVPGLACLLGMLWFASGVAQTPGTGAGSLVLRPLAPSGGRGVSNGPLIDRAEVRVSRVDVEPNGVRNVHAHDDMQFHLFVAVAGSVRLEVESQNVQLGPWQAHFIKGGTQHGFTNAGTSTATILEVFVKK